MATEALTAPFFGPLADRYGRRPVFLTCVCLWGCGAVAFGLMTSLGSLIATRAFCELSFLPWALSGAAWEVHRGEQGERAGQMCAATQRQGDKGWVLICVVGLLSGAGVLSRTMVGELSDKSNRVQGESSAILTNSQYSGVAFSKARSPNKHEVLSAHADCNSICHILPSPHCRAYTRVRA